MRDIPVVINCRDRVSDLRALIGWLEHAGHERIILLDNASTWPPLLDYYRDTPHKVVRLGRNVGSRALWEAELVGPGRLAAGWFVYTDPDVIPTDECPLDAVAYLRELLGRHPEFSKAGLGLHLDDVPAAMPSLEWERRLVDPGRQIEPSAFSSLVDTTFALHRPGTPFMFEAIRTGKPYEARHASWYVREPDEETAYYLAHAVGGETGSSWLTSRERHAVD